MHHGDDDHEDMAVALVNCVHTTFMQSIYIYTHISSGYEYYEVQTVRKKN